MTGEHPIPSAPRRFGVVHLVAAVAASAALAAGGTWLLTGRGGSAPHAHDAEQAGPSVEQWQCPMHPTIVQDHPGDCPICGMKLVKVGGAAGSAAGSAGGAGAASEPQPEKWQCPMHPSIVEDHPGDCPVCGMKLVKVAGTGPLPEGLAGVTIDPARQQLIGMKIVHVERGPVGGAWRTNGRIAVDETRIHHVNVKFNGFMDRVYADFIGKPVRRGEPIFSIYSPELLAAQEEYLLALRTRKTLGGPAGAMSADGESLVRASRRKLELWDVPQAEIERIEKAGEASRTVTFYSPATGVLTKKDVVPGMKVSAGDMPFEIIDLSHVWVLADAYETDLRHVKVGMKATLNLKAFPGRPFTGRVAFIDPLLDPRTRTAKVRIDFPNPTGELRPELFGEVVLEGKPRDALRIPADAVIDSGTKSVVFVALPDGKFQPREVGLGETDGAWTEVTFGLEKGDGVVTRANFLVDSESRLRASLEALTAASARPAAPSTAPAAAPRWFSAWAPEPLKAVLRPLWRDRITQEELENEMDAALQLPGISNAWTMPIKGRLDMLSTGIRTPIGIKISGADLATIERVAKETEAVVQKVPGTRSVYAERVAGGYFLDFVLKRDQLARYGLSVDDANMLVMTAVGGDNQSTTVEGRERYGINVRYARDYREDLQALRRVLLPLPSGQGQVPMEEIADVVLTQGPSMIRDENGLLAGYVYVDFDTSKVDIGGYVAKAKAAVEAAVKVPTGYAMGWSGQYENMLRVRERLKIILPITLVLIFALLYMNTKSAFKASLVMLAVPFSAIGAVWFLWALDYNVSIAVWVGMIALMGLDAETGVFMLLFLDLSHDEAKRKGLLRTRGDLVEAIVHGAVKRVRPKAMTVTAAMLGLLPIMWSTGTGADVMKRIAAPMIGGLVTSFLLELLVYPAVYYLWKKREVVEGPPTPAAQGETVAA